MSTDSSRRSHWPLVVLSSGAALVSLLIPLLLVRILSPDEVGHFKIFFLYITLAPAISLSAGIMSGLAYWSGQPAERRYRAIRASALTVLLLGAVVSTAALIFHDAIANLFGWSGEQALLFSAALCGAVAASFFDEAAIATGRILRGAVFYSGFELLRALAIIGAALHFRSLTAVFFAYTAVVLLKLVCGLVSGWMLGLVGVPVTRADMKGVWSYALPVSLAWVLGIFVAMADQFILSTVISPAEFALYSIGCLSLPPLLIFEQSVTRVLIPQMSARLAEGRVDRVVALYRRAVEELGFFFIPAVAGLAVFAVPIIDLLFTSRYADASHYLRLYAFSYLLLIVPYDALSRAAGGATWILRTFTAFSFISLGLAALGTVAIGPTGALCAVLASGAVLRAYSLRHFSREVAQPLKLVLPLRSLGMYLLISTGLAATALCASTFFQSDRLWFLVCAPAFAAAYFIFAIPIRRAFADPTERRGSVMILTQSLNIGGLERMVLHLCEWIKTHQGMPIEVLAYDQDEGSESLIPEFTQRGIPVDAFKKPPGFSPRVVARIVRAVYERNVAVIHSQDLGGLVYAVAAKLCCAGRLSIVHTQHSFIHLDRKARYRAYEKVLTRFVDRLTVVSEDTRSTYEALGFSRNKIHLIQNGIVFSPRAVRPRSECIRSRAELLQRTSGGEAIRRLKDHTEDYWILYLARFFPGKGQDHAVRLWAELDPEVRSQSVLCFLGPESAPGQYDRIRALIGDAPDSDRILLLGATNQPESWLSVSDLFLSCSEFEGMPLAPLQAAGCGVPLILSHIPGHDFLSELSAQFPLHDYRRGAQHIRSLLIQSSQGGEPYWDRLWRCGERVRSTFSIEAMSRSYSMLYAEELGHDAGRGG